MSYRRWVVTIVSAQDEGDRQEEGQEGKMVESTGKTHSGGRTPMRRSRKSTCGSIHPSAPSTVALPRLYATMLLAYCRLVRQQATPSASITCADDSTAWIDWTRRIAYSAMRPESDASFCPLPSTGYGRATTVRCQQDAAQGYDTC